MKSMLFPLEVVHRIRQKVKYGLMMKFVLDRIAMLGVEITPFYLVEERLWEDLAPCFEKGFEEFEITWLGPAEMETIAAIRKYNFSKEQLLQRLEKGQVCLGVRQQGTLAAFTWADLSKCAGPWFRFSLEENKAYLFDAYTLEAFRGKRLAQFIRYSCYRALNQMGKETFYSISEAFNSPSIRFKTSLKAKRLSLWVAIELFGRYRRVWKLRNCA
ncbi:MAG: hypothetical protein WBM28_13260 [Burkholderiales bacterium]